MSHRLTAGLLAATTLVTLSILVAQPALAQDADNNINQARRDCNVPQPDCRNLGGNALSACELKVGQIIHACNKVRAWEEAHGGEGPRFNGATWTRNNATNRGEADTE